MDADIHGPSINKMLGIEKSKIYAEGDRPPAPVKKHDNFYALSTASFIETPETPLIWRGPMKMKLLNQFIEDIEWPEIDYMVIDCPPGTGDEPISVIQLFDKIDYAVIVSTPQELSLLDVKKAVNFLNQLNIQNKGIIENMAGFVCPHCGEEVEIFSKGNVEKYAKEQKIPFLGSIPMDKDVSATGDTGRPYVYDYNKRPAAQKMDTAASKIAEFIGE